MDKAYAGLLEAVYSAPERPELWADVMDIMANAIGARTAALWHRDQLLPASRAQVDHLIGWDDAAVRGYTEFYHARELRLPLIHATKEGGVFVDDRDMDFRIIADSEVHNDFYRRHGLGRAMAIRVFGDASRTSLIGLLRPLDRGEFTARDIRLAEVVAPHLARSLQLMRQLERARAVGEGLRMALDRFPMAVLLLDRAVRVVAMNRAAEELVRDRDCPLRIAQGRLDIPMPGVMDGLLAIIARSGPDCAHESPPSDVLRVKLRTGQALGLMAAPCDHAGSITPGGRLTMLFISDPRRALLSDTHVLMGQFGLSRAEAAVALLMTTGETAEAIAERRGVSRETVRTQVKNIYARTDTRSQAELVGLLGRSLGVLGA